MAGSVVTVGTFDGVHRGHMAVLEAVRKRAAEMGMRPVAVTFDRHPLATVCPERAPMLIMSPDDRDSLIRACGVEVELVEFTADVMRKSSAEWMRELKKRLDMRSLVLGYDNSFGCDCREMTSEAYASLGRELGVEVTVAPLVEGCSSSAARRAIKEGDMGRAAAILGRPYCVRGRVVDGRKLGRTIGVPTANIAVPPELLEPAPGVYCGSVALGDGCLRPAVVNVGANPTVTDDGVTRVEAHLLDFSGDLYGRTVEAYLLRRIRGERKFSSLEELRRAIDADIRCCKSCQEAI